MTNEESTGAGPLRSRPRWAFGGCRIVVTGEATTAEGGNRGTNEGDAAASHGRGRSASGGWGADRHGGGRHGGYTDHLVGQVEWFRHVHLGRDGDRIGLCAQGHGHGRGVLQRERGADDPGARIRVVRLPRELHPTRGIHDLGDRVASLSDGHRGAGTDRHPSHLGTAGRRDRQRGEQLDSRRQELPVPTHG